jgi:predicted DNA-binding ribbon-helix-helix protein
MGGLVKSPVIKRSICLGGRKTSVSLEDAFWKGLRAIAATRALTLSDLIRSIDANRKQGNLSSALRLFVLDHYRSQVAQANDQPSNASEGPKSLLP